MTERIEMSPTHLALILEAPDKAAFSRYARSRVLNSGGGADRGAHQPRPHLSRHPREKQPAPKPIAAKPGSLPPSRHA